MHIKILVRLFLKNKVIHNNIHDKMSNLRTLKCSLKSITSNDNVHNEINKIIARVNNIVIHAYQFIKLFTLYKYKNKFKAPKIDLDFILCVLKTVSFNTNKAGRKFVKNKNLMIKLNSFYDNIFKNLIVKQEDCSNLAHMFVYIATDILTNITNNIRIHFMKHLKNFVKFMYKSNGIVMQKGSLNITLKALVDPTIIVDFKNSKCSINGHLFVDYIRYLYLPKIRGKNLYENINNNPLKFLKYMIKMSTAIENYNKNLNDQDKYKMHKMYQILPLRNDIIPKYIPIDTTIILDLLIDNNISNLYHGKKQSDITNIWKYAFNGLYSNKNKKLISSGKKPDGFVFNNLIFTDGYAVSIIQVKKHMYGKKHKNTILPKNYVEFKYIDQLNEDELKKLNEYKLVGVDPGKRNIVCMVDDKRNKLSYSCMQRRSECLFKHTKIVLDKMRTDEVIKKETELSKFNSKSCIIENFSAFVKEKNKINNDLMNVYQNIIFRKYKWKTYIHTQQSEMRLVNSIKEKFAPNKEKICLAYGDWTQSQQMANYLSTPGIGMRRMLKKHFMQIKIDEFRTSKLCFACEHETENFMIRKNPKTYMSGDIKVHSLLRCKNVNCNKLWDRDTNGSSNILKLAKYYIEKKSRKEKFRRTVDI